MSDDANTQKEFVAGVFSRAASTYDRIGPPFFAHFGRRLVELARIRRGAQVLDVATGTGAVLFPAAEQVGPHGYVVGVDLADPMVQAAAAEIRRQGLANAEVCRMDAERLAFPDAAFDFVLCGLSLFFFPHLQRSLTEFRRVLRRDGRVAVTTFAEQDEPSRRVDKLLKAYQVEYKLMLHSLRTPAEIEAAAQKAAFNDIQVTREEVDFVYADEEEWWAMSWSHGLRAALERMTSDTLERFKTDAFAMMQAFKQADGVHHPRRVLYTLARSPG